MTHLSVPHERIPHERIPRDRIPRDRIWVPPRVSLARRLFALSVLVAMLAVLVGSLVGGPLRWAWFALVAG